MHIERIPEWTPANPVEVTIAAPVACCVRGHHHLLPMHPRGPIRPIRLGLNGLAGPLGAAFTGNDDDPDSP